MKSRRWLAALVAACCIWGSGCSDRTAVPVMAPEQKDQQAVSQEESTAPAPVEQEIISRSVLLAAGDNLIHDSLYRQANERTGGNGYDFKPLYDRVQAQIEAADIAFINQETMMVEDRAPSSYPMFNTPVEMATDLREVGFDLLSIANNHMLDQGATGLEKTIQLIRSTDGLTLSGGYETPEEREQTAVVEANGITFAFVSFTQHTNGLSLPAGSEYMAIYTDDSAEIARQLKQARERADVVVVSVHWGEENTYTPTPYQRQKAQEFADAGADIILGTHPHVLQPIESVVAADGRQVPVIYSLGNFVSAQIESANLLGGIVEIAVEKNQSTEKITIERPVLTPVVTHYGGGMRELAVYPLAEYSDALAAEHGLRIGYGKRFDMAFLHTILTEVIGAEYLTEDARPIGEEELV